MFLLYLAIAILILLVMITIHEFGHYCAGKLLGFKINEFSIGFGKSIFSRKNKKGEQFSIRVVPLGGYCAFEGEENESEDSGAFMKQKPWKRLIVLFSGAFFNFLSAIIFAVLLLTFVGYDIPQVYEVNPVVQVISSDGLQNNDTIVAVNNKVVVETQGSQVYALLEDYDGNNFILTVKRDNTLLDLNVTITISSNAYVEGADPLKSIMKNDVIYGVNGERVNFVNDRLVNNMITEYAEKNPTSDTITLNVKRNGEMVDIEIKLLDTGITQDGVDVRLIGTQLIAYRYSFGEALLSAIPFCFGMAWKILVLLFQLFTLQLSITAVGGPITTITTIATFAQSQLSSVLVLLPLIAINLAVFNLLPIPALDGSKMVFTTIEWIRGKPINPKVENTIHTIGLIALFAFVIVADIFQLFF